ncbi:hydroxycarboxylic acid receptor 2-like [Diretmus argenteus]
MHCHFSVPVLISVLPPVFIIVFILGVIGNGLALWIFWFHLKPWKSSTVLLFNLALADLLVTIALPFRAHYYNSGMNWIFGGSFCNISIFVLGVNYNGSILFLMAIAVDRYIHVVHPHHRINSLSVCKAAWGAVVLWLFPIAMMTQVLTIPRNNTTNCESFIIETEPSVSLNWHRFVFVISFYLPLVVILYCTFCIIGQLRRRQMAQDAKIKRALCFITVVVVLFIICFLPSNIVQLLIWSKTQKLANIPASQVCEALEDLNTAFYITLTLTSLNSMLDPVVYYFSSPTFKNICRRAVHLGQAEDIEESGERKTPENAPSPSANCDSQATVNNEQKDKIGQDQVL